MREMSATDLSVMEVLAREVTQNNESARYFWLGSLDERERGVGLKGVH